MKRIGFIIFAAALIGCVEEDARNDGGTTGDGGTNQCLIQLSCPMNMHCVGTACVCNDGFTQDGGICISTAPADGGTNQCLIPLNCPANMHCMGTGCVCDDNFVASGGLCLPRDGGTIGPGCVGSNCARFTRVRVTVVRQSLLDQGYTVPTLWTTDKIMVQGSGGSLIYTVQSSDNGYLWITVRRGGSTQEITPPACQSAADFGLKIEGELNGNWIDVSNGIPAERDTDANRNGTWNGTWKFQWWIIDGERVADLQQRPCQP